MNPFHGLDVEFATKRREGSNEVCLPLGKTSFKIACMQIGGISLAFQADGFIIP